MSTMCSDYASENQASVRRNGTFGETHARAKAGFGSALSRLTVALWQAVLWPARVLAARRELEMLGQMSEYELKDIGLTSSDLADVTALPADASPTDFLATRVEERHRARYV
jgi:uncharacterized protein YjiS (DUF1127 family)